LPLVVDAARRGAAGLGDDLGNVALVVEQQRRVDDAVAGVEDGPRHCVQALDRRERLHRRRSAVNVARPGDVARHDQRHLAEARAADRMISPTSIVRLSTGLPFDPR
jgi:hypothetical protein